MLSHPQLVVSETWGGYVLQAPWVYVWRAGDRLERRLTVPAGFATDLASVPRLLWWLIEPRDLKQASIAHDLIYRSAGYLAHDQFTIDGEPTPMSWSRKDADRLFARIMREAGVPKWKRRAAYLAVRLFGRFAWGPK